MSVDLSKARIGDSVTLGGVIRGFKCDYITVSLTDQEGNFERTYHPREILSHTPKALSVGDRVVDSCYASDLKATVLFVDEKDTVVRTDEGGIHSGPTGGAWALKLERIP